MKEKRCAANGCYIKVTHIIKEGAWSKSIIAVAHRWRHQTYQHQSASVTAAASQSGMCMRHQLSSGSILRSFVKNWRCQRAVMFAATEFCCWHFFFMPHATNVSFPPLHVSATTFHKRHVHLTECYCLLDTSQQPAFQGSINWRIRQSHHAPQCMLKTTAELDRTSIDN